MLEVEFLDLIGFNLHVSALLYKRLYCEIVMGNPFLPGLLKWEEKPDGKEEKLEIESKSMKELMAWTDVAKLYCVSSTNPTKSQEVASNPSTPCSFTTKAMAVCHHQVASSTGAAVAAMVSDAVISSLSKKT